jgi:hypothetical protein
MNVPDGSKILRAWPPTAIVADADANMYLITAPRRRGIPAKGAVSTAPEQIDQHPGGGTGSYGTALARHLRSAGVEVNQPDKATRRRWARTTPSTPKPLPGRSWRPGQRQRQGR